MKIKRFEASNMSEALRAVKKEFGDDAVILSAKTVKKTNRLFSGKGRKQVVVTAAIDRSTTSSETRPFEKVEQTPKSVEMNYSFPGTNTIGTQAEGGGLAPITRTGRKKLKSKFVRLASEINSSRDNPEKSKMTLYQRLAVQGVDSWIAQEWSQQVGQLLSASNENSDESNERSALSNVINAGTLIAPAFHGNNKSQRKVVLVGPAGVGKTTTAAKLAATAKMQSQSVTVLSLDNCRIAGTEELERYARIIGFELKVINGSEALQEALRNCQKEDLVVVDTPGMALKDHSTRNHLVDAAGKINASEIHLLMNAGSQNHVMNAILDFFKPLGIERLLYTHLDWVTEYGPLINLSFNSELPISYLSDSYEIPDGFHTATARRLTELLYPKSKSNEDDFQVTVVKSQSNKMPDDRFLANRNSDIFHRPVCRSVQRINNDNILLFDNEMDAMAQSYKPCRMCCSDLLIPTSFNKMSYSPNAKGRYR